MQAKTRTLIKNITIVNPKESLLADILIEGDTIKQVSKNIQEKADIVIEGEGKHAFPGFVDLHVHLRIPGREDEEDIRSGSAAAVKGGFSDICCMPNTEPAIDNEGLVSWIIEEGKKVNLLDVHPIAAITKDRKGCELTEFGALKAAGCCALSDDGSSVADSLLFRRALEYATMHQMLIISHCEDSRLAANGSMRESYVSSKYGIGAIADISESLAVFRDIEIAKFVKARIHLAHISSFKSLEIIRNAKAQGVKVTAETCPHYFALTVEDVEASEFDANFKVNPPLGEKEDLLAVCRALKDGTIDCISTDHAPHSCSEKELPFENVPFGFIGLELSFSLSYTFLVKTKILTLNQLVEKMSYRPAEIIGLKNRGMIKKGFIANIVVADLNKKWQVTKESIVSKSKNTPFLGRTLTGLIETNISKGRQVYSL
ncbi:MAG: dihydroorotase [Candidatus Omnitrophica bacterium]|nr:dihydroorotase [Candidatus Omnitrophota bacterium]